MAPQHPWLTITTREQATVQHGVLAVTPQTQVITVRTPLGLWRWARPEALLVESEQGLSRVPIQDTTRWLWLGAWLAAFMTIVLLRSSTRTRI